jgi:hypothetical protein
MKDKTRAYLAGLLDAEGHCTVVKGDVNGCAAYSCRFGITNTYRPIMNWIVRNFGGSYRLLSNKRPRHHKITYEWHPSSGPHANKILSSILPYIIVKRCQASLLMQLYELDSTWNPNKRDKIYRSVWKLNHPEEFGSVTTEMPSFPNKLFNAYFAGFFDGEGTICISKKWGKKNKNWYYVLCIRVGNTNPVALYEAGSLYGQRVLPRKSKGCPFFMLELSKQIRQEKFLLTSLPYMQIKKEQAILALNIIRSRYQRNSMRDKWYHQMKALKNVGKKTQSELIGDDKSAFVGTRSA